MHRRPRRKPPSPRINMNASAAPLRVAVIGVGSLGAIHADIYHRMPGVELVAVVDTDRARANAAAARHGCVALDSAAALTGPGAGDGAGDGDADGAGAAAKTEVDAVSIVVPTTAHREVAEVILNAGIHALLEKPVAETVADARAIVDLAAKQKVILQIGHLERFNAGVMKLVELADNPRFIEVHRLGAFVERATDVDVVADLMIHDIDIVLSLVKSELKHVFAAGARVITSHIDIANARLEFANGAVANVTASRVSRNRFRRIRVFAACGYLGLNFTDQQLDHVFPAPAGAAEFPKLIERRVAVDARLPLNAELAHFVDCARHRRRPLVTGEDGLIAVQVAQQVRQKIAESISQSSGE